MSENGFGHTHIAFKDVRGNGKIRTGPAFRGPPPNRIDVRRSEDDGTVRSIVSNTSQTGQQGSSVRWLLLEARRVTVATSNKQLNFIQHVVTILRPGGRAAVVVPDNCLFADQAGEVFGYLTEDCALHTVLRLPNGTFSPYSPGTKTNVIFFTKGYKTGTVWVYDARTNVPRITKKDRPLTPEYFAGFEKCFGNDPNGKAKRKQDDSREDRWRSFSIGEVKERDYKIDGLKWLKDESLDEFDPDVEPQELATDAIAELEAAVEELNQIVAMLEANGNGNGEGSKLSVAGKKA